MFKVYLIENLKTNKKYVGYTSFSIRERFLKHLNNAKHQRTGKLYDSMRKHGKDLFTVVELASTEDNEEVKNLERKYIEQFDSYRYGYNMTFGVDGQPSPSQHTRDLLREKNLGKVLSEEHKRKIGDSNKGVSRKKSKPQTFSEASKLKMSRSHIGKKAWNKGIKTGRQTIISCLLCKHSGGITNMRRWHLENCKYGL